MRIQEKVFPSHMAFIERAIRHRCIFHRDGLGKQLLSLPVVSPLFDHYDQQNLELLENLRPPSPKKITPVTHLYSSS